VNVTQISVSVQYAFDLSQWGGGWKTVELGAEATLSPDRPWKEEQAVLYAELPEQLKVLFARTKKE